jgi:hypothetical protein
MPPLGKAAGIGFLLHEHAAIEAFDAAAVADGLEEGIMLLGAGAGEGLEPVGIVRGPLAGGPFLHAAGHLIGQLPVDPCAPWWMA